jgi:hypothetical protein
MDSRKVEAEKNNFEDIYAPTKDELAAIGNGVFVLKNKPANVVISSYHMWQNIWNDKLKLRVPGENKENIYLALSISVPAHLGFPTDDRHEIPYSGFVAAVSVTGGDTRVIPLNKVEWVSKIG